MTKDFNLRVKFTKDMVVNGRLPLETVEKLWVEKFEAEGHEVGPITFGKFGAYIIYRPPNQELWCLDFIEGYFPEAGIPVPEEASK